MALRDKNIGFDRQLSNDWLNKVAYIVADGSGPEEVKIKLRNSFEDNTSDALRKTINLLMGIWSTVPEEIVPLRNRAIKLFLEADDIEKKIIHYFMSIANYPFFYDICILIGRALKLSDHFSGKQMISKIQEKWGERSTTIRAVQRSIRTIEQWGWLKSENQVFYAAFNEQQKIFLPEKFHGFIANCILLGSLRKSMLIDEIIQNPGIFPFHLKLSQYELKNEQGILVESRGKDDILISLRKPGDQMSFMDTLFNER